MIILQYLLGASIGSFFCLVYERRALGRSIISPASHCGNCKHRLGFYDLLPGLSYLLLKGRCRYCKAKYEPNSFYVEVFLGLGFIVNYFSFSWQLMILLLAYGYCSLSDLKELAIPAWIPLFTTILIVPINLVNFNLGLGVIISLVLLLCVWGGMGIGDFGLMLPTIFYLGYLASLKFLLISSLLAILFFVIKKRQVALPFVPYLSWGLLFTVLLNLVF